MEGILKSTRTGILMALRTLPLILISFIGFMAAGLANAGLLILFIGQIAVLPLAVYISQYIFSRMGDPAISPFYVKTTNVSLLVPSSGYAEMYINVAPSYWMAQIWFFFAYTFTNAMEIWKLPEDKRLDKTLIANRKTKAIMIMGAILVTVIGLSLFRFSTGAETPMGMLIALVLGSSLGYGWYMFALNCGVAASDVFGMVQQIIPFTDTEQVMTCVYNPR
jgi:hypothetical protein